jgi:hypothetical protein
MATDHCVEAYRRTVKLVVARSIQTGNSSTALDELNAESREALNESRVAAGLEPGSQCSRRPPQRLLRLRRLSPDDPRVVRIKERLRRGDGWGRHAREVRNERAKWVTGESGAMSPQPLAFRWICGGEVGDGERRLASARIAARMGRSRGVAQPG